jgi:hypothetical protein
MQKPIAVLVCALFCLSMTAGQGRSPKQSTPAKPLPAKGDYATGIYGLTFKAPQHALYCPLPDDWTGSDHGTVVFLESPRACYGAGYPSSGRGFEPADVPRIEIYYGYDLGEDEAKPPPCKVAGTATLFGKKANLCRDNWRGLVTLAVSGRYTADQPAEFVATLVVEPVDQQRYLPLFTTLVASVRTCSEKWTDGGLDKKKTFVIGQGPPCPRTKWF